MNKKKLLALLMALVMILTLMPMTVFADDVAYPKAEVVRSTAIHDPVNVYNLAPLLSNEGNSSGVSAYGTVTPSVVYSFTAPGDENLNESTGIGSYICDYVVSITDSTITEETVAVKAYSFGLFGNYGSFGDIGFFTPIDANYNQEIPLLGTVTKIPWTYHRIATEVGTFTCGAFNTAKENLGKTFTVKLVLWDPQYTTYEAAKAADAVHVVRKIDYVIDTVSPLYVGDVPYVYKSTGRAEDGFMIATDGTYGNGAMKWLNEEELKEYTGPHYAPIVASVTVDGKESGFTSVADAIAFAKDGQTVKLLRSTSMTGTTELTMDKSVTLDLNGKALTVERINLRKGGLNVVTSVPGGTVSCESQAFNVYGSETDVANYTTLTIGKDVTVNSNYAICLFTPDYPGQKYLCYGATVNINGTLTGNNGTVFVQGYIGNNQATGAALAASANIPAVNIGSTAVITSNTDQAIAMNGMAVVNVADGAQITGREAIGVKRGILNVKGGTLTATGTNHDPAEANNSGTEATGAAISVTSTYNYAGDIQVNVSGGTIVSTNSAALYVGHSKSGNKDNCFANGATLNVTGGNFRGVSGTAVYVADAISGDATMPAGFISGGKYSACPNGAYVKYGYEAVDIQESSYIAQVGKVKATDISVPQISEGKNPTYTYTADKKVVDTANETTVLDDQYNITVKVIPTTEEVVRKDEPSTAVAKVENITESALKDLVQEAAEAAPSNVESIVNVTIQVAKDAAQKDTEAETVTKVSYDVHPQAVIQVQGSEKKTVVELSNDQINPEQSFTFTLDISDLTIPEGHKLVVRHLHSDGSEDIIDPSKISYNDGKITISGIKSFSTISATTAPVGEYSASFGGFSLRRRVKLDAYGQNTDVVVNTSADIRMTFNWTLPVGATVDKDNSYFYWKTTTSDNWREVKMANYDGSSASLVLTGVRDDQFDLVIESKIKVAYRMSGSSEVQYIEFTADRTHSVNSAAQALKNISDGKWANYAKYLLREGVSSYVITQSSPYYSIG